MVQLTLICNNGDTCNVNCYDNSCNNLTLIENGGTIVVTCYYDAQKSEACPNGKQLSSFMYNMPMLNDSTLISTISTSNGYSTSYSNSYSLCNFNNTINCNDYNECNGNYGTTEIINSNVNGSICCSASQACSNVANILLNGTNSNGMSSIRCDAFLSCHLSTITVLNGGNIYASSIRSCESCTITATSVSDIFCNGDGACSNFQC